MLFPEGEAFCLQQPAAGAPRPFRLPRVQPSELDNGLQVFLVERHTLPIVSMDLEFDGGARRDAPGKTGLANVCMAMLMLMHGDVVLAGPGVEDLFLERAERREIRGIQIPVACPEDIVASDAVAEIGNLADAAFPRWPQARQPTALYVRPDRRTPERVLDAAPLAPGAIKQNPTSASQRLAGLATPRIRTYRAKERTRTSTGVTPLAPQNNQFEFPESFQCPSEPQNAPKRPKTPPEWGTTPGPFEDASSSLGEISTQPAALGPVGSAVGWPNGVPHDFTNGVNGIATFGAGWGTGLQVPQQPVGLPGLSELDILSLSVRVLCARALGDEVPRDEALALARAALAATDVGRLALEVLDGGPRATAAAVQLAAMVAAAGVEATDAKSGGAR